MRKIDKIKKYLIGEHASNFHVMIELTTMDYHKVKKIVFSSLVYLWNLDAMRKEGVTTL